MMLTADIQYQQLLAGVMTSGDDLDSRNGPVKSCIDLPVTRFHQTPLITLRKTAWRKALREMEWFLSGDPQCPDELMDWWQGQLNPNGRYEYGYGHQMRHFGDSDSGRGYDQVRALVQSLCAHPHSRRLVMTTWHPWDMNHITALNENSNTPTTCHGTVIQVFVRGDRLHLATYQRSADLLLGVPHNWCQYWGLLLWLAAQCDLLPGTLQWHFGDAHIYQHPTHLDAVSAILKADSRRSAPTLEYRRGAGTPFAAADFEMIGVIPEPVTAVRPVRL